MCKGICTSRNNIGTITSLLAQNNINDLIDLTSNDYFSNRIGADLSENFRRSQENNTTILLESSNARNKQLITELCVWNKYKWDNGSKLKVKFISDPLGISDKIIECANEWYEYANIEFLKVDNIEDAEIRVGFVQDFSSWSYIGKSCLGVANYEPTMNFGWFTPRTDPTEFKRVVLHEFGHALGCIHEHQHPDANIPWDEGATRRVYTTIHGWSEEKVNDNILNNLPPAQLSRSEYDTDSIMHYFFPKELTINGLDFKHNYELSERDKEFISTMYPK